MCFLAGPGTVEVLQHAWFLSRTEEQGSPLDLERQIGDPKGPVTPHVVPSFATGLEDPRNRRQGQTTDSVNGSGVPTLLHLPSLHPRFLSRPPCL